MERRTEFLYASLLDVQSTIRSVDVRAGFVFLILFAPLAISDKIVCAFAQLAARHDPLIWAAPICGGVWALSLIALFLAVTAISNPAQHVAGTVPRGGFYGADLYRLSSWQLINPSTVVASRTVDEELQAMPETEVDVQAELVFEKLKLSYIRDLKLARYNLSVRLTAAWLVISILAVALIEATA